MEQTTQNRVVVSSSGAAESSMSAKEFMRKFAKDAGIRALRTMAQTAVSLIGAKVFISDVDWKALCSAVVLSGLLSVLTSVATGLPETAANT